MRVVLTYLPALACLGMMAVVCIPMLLRHRKHAGSDPTGQLGPTADVTQLREEVARLTEREALREFDRVDTSDG